VANQKGKKAIDNASVNFNKINVYGCILLFSSHFSLAINHFGGFVIVKYKLTTSIRGLAPVVQKVDNAIHRINHYPLDNSIGFAIVYPLDSDLSGG